MKIQFVSDLHLEFADNSAYLKNHPLEVTGDMLLIAGDSAYLDVLESGRDTYSQYEFWDWASNIISKSLSVWETMISTVTMIWRFLHLCYWKVGF